MKLNKIYNENCIDTMARMPDNFIDLTVTSPPYDNLRTYNDNIDQTWGEDVWKPIIKELYRVTKEGGIVVWVVGDATINGSETGVSFRQALYAMKCGYNLHDTMIYEKKNISFPDSVRYYSAFEYMFIFSKGKPNCFNPITKLNERKGKKIRSLKRGKDGVLVKDSGYKNNKKYPDNSIIRNIWRYTTGTGSSVDKSAFNHPAIYPEKLARDHIYSWSNKGDLVYDPFMGSGTTAKMAHLQKRKWIGSEISKEYVELAYKRLKPYLTQTTLF